MPTDLVINIVVVNKNFMEEKKMEPTMAKNGAQIPSMSRKRLLKLRRQILVVKADLENAEKLCDMALADGKKETFDPPLYSVTFILKFLEKFAKRINVWKKPIEGEDMDDSEEDEDDE